MLETTTSLPNSKAEHRQPALLQVSMVQGNDNDMLGPRTGGGDGGGGGESANIEKGEGGGNRGCHKVGPIKFPVKEGGREYKTIEDGGITVQFWISKVHTSN